MNRGAVAPVGHLEPIARDHDDVRRDVLVLVASLVALGLLVAAATLVPWLVVLVGPPVFVTRSLIRRAGEEPRH
jgi:hypothetical protein